MKIIRAFGMRLELPRAASLTTTDLADLTTGPLRETAGWLSDAQHIMPPREFWTPLPAPVPGRLLEGTLPDDHHARFLLRLPKEWNGRLVVAASSGITDEHTYDLYLSDFLLSQGYAFAATDKGVRRAVLDGDTVFLPQTPAASVRRWYPRLEALARLAAQEAEKHHARKPEKTYAVGLSNGGYLARLAAESDSGLFDGALEISGVLWRADKGNLLRELPAALRATAKTPWDREALARAGFPADEARWDPVIAQYASVYWSVVAGLFLGDLDPDYAGAPEDYDLDARPAGVKDAIRTFENSGDLKIPLISLSGKHDYLISCAGHALAYRDLVFSRGKAGLHRLILVDDATHIDTDRQGFPFVEPLLPRAHEAFRELVALDETVSTGRSSRRPR